MVKAERYITCQHRLQNRLRSKPRPRAVQVASHFKSHPFTKVAYKQQLPLDHFHCYPGTTQASFPELNDSSNILVTFLSPNCPYNPPPFLYPLSNVQDTHLYSHQRSMFGEDDSESPRVASPWDPFLASPSSRSVSSLELSSSLASCTPGSAPMFPRGIPKLVPEAEQVLNPILLTHEGPIFTYSPLFDGNP